jgi:hypothetical protein
VTQALPLVTGVSRDLPFVATLFAYAGSEYAGVTDTARAVALNAQIYAGPITGNSITSITCSTAVSLDVFVTVTNQDPSPGLQKRFAPSTENQTGDVFFDNAARSILFLARRFDPATQRARQLLQGETTSPLNVASWVGGTTEGMSAARPLESRHPWIGSVYALVRDHKPRKAGPIIFGAIEGYLEKNDLRSLGEVLAEVDVEKLDPYTMTALLRISGRAKLSLPSWGTLLERVIQELIRTKYPNPSGLLVGLET